MRSVGLLSALAAAAMLQGNVVERDPEAEAARRKTPPPERDPRFIGVDVGREPGRAVTFSHADMERISAAQAKRDRKARKRLASVTEQEKT